MHVWHDVIDAVVAGKNEDKPIHSSFPSQMLVGPFSIGDYVRKPHMPGPFPKGAREQKWSDQVYRILSRDRARYPGR